MYIPHPRSALLYVLTGPIPPSFFHFLWYHRAIGLGRPFVSRCQGRDITSGHTIYVHS